MICCLNFIAQLIVYGCFQIFYRFFINDIVVDNLIAIVYGFWQTFYFFIIDSDLVKLPAFVFLSFYTFSAQRIWLQNLYCCGQINVVFFLNFIAQLVIYGCFQIFFLAFVYLIVNIHCV